MTTCTMCKTFEDFGAVGDGATDDKAALNEALAWAMSTATSNGNAKISGCPGSVYACNEASWNLTTDGHTTTFTLGGTVVPVVQDARNLYVRYRDHVLDSNHNANSGQPLTPGTDFTYNPSTHQITFATTYGSVDTGNITVIEGLNIQASNIILDGNGCQFVGSARFYVVGAPTTAGQEPPLRNVHLRNFECTGNGTYNVAKGPELYWCINSSVEGVRAYGLVGTAFNLHMCWGCWMRDCACIGSNGGFGWLVFHCRNCVVENFYCTDLPSSKWQLAGQVKGGFSNRIVNCVAYNCTHDTDTGVSTDFAFYSRGDDPDDPAGTYVFGLYPYDSGSWLAADTQRATRECEWIGCSVAYDSAVGSANKFTIGYQWQQSINGEYVGCNSYNAGGFKANRTVSSPLGTWTGSEKNVIYRDCSVRQCTGRAFEMVGDSTAALGGVRILGAQVDTASDGVRLTYCDKPLVQDFAIDACTSNGVYSPSSIDVRLINGVVTGTTTSEGVQLAANTLAVKGAYLRNVECTGNGVANWAISVPVDTDLLRPAFNTKQTTTGSAVLVNSITIPDSTNWLCECEFVGFTVSGAINRFRSMIGATATSGAASFIGSKIDLEMSNPDGLGGISFAVSGATLQLKIAGKASTTVNWELSRATFSRLE